MNKYFENIREIIRKGKKKIIRRISILIVFLAVMATGFTITIYNIAKSNINYTVEEAKEIVLQAVKGELLHVNKKLELDNLSFQYEFKIKNSNNMLMEVIVDSKLGAITDMDNYYD